MTQPTLLSFKPSKINIPVPSLSNETTNSPPSPSQPPEVNFKSQQHKNHSEIEDKTSRRRDREKGPQGSIPCPTAPFPLPSTTDNGATSPVTTPLEPHPERGPRPHPVMQDPEFQKRYRKFLKRNGLEYGTSDPKKSALWLRFWDVELKRWYDREGTEK